MTGRAAAKQALGHRLWWVKEGRTSLEKWRYRVERRRTRTAVPADRPSIILLSVDSLGAGHLGCYGYDRATSPAIDRLAERSVVFENVISQSTWTKPSLASFHTALYPSVHKADSPGEAGDRIVENGAQQANVLTSRFRTMAQEFSAAGYATAGFTEGGYAHSAFGFGRGFDVYDNHAGGVKSCAYRLLRWVLTLPPGVPFFAFVHCWDIHFPYMNRRPYNRLFTTSREDIVLDGKLRVYVNRGQTQLTVGQVDHLRGLYDGAIRYVDDQIGALTRELETLGIRDRTVLALTADHGEAFMEHGKIEHTECIYNEVVRIPLLLHSPSLLGAGQVRAQTRAIDVMPTLLDLAGLRPTETVQGVSLQPWMRGERKDDLPAVTESERTGGQRAWSDGHYKLIHRRSDDRYELYDLLEDPGERRDLAATQPAALASVIERLRAWERETETLRARYWDGAAEPDAEDMDPDVVRRLEELGYLG